MGGEAVAGAPGARLLHATCLEIGGCGVLILGVPGSGKSDLALRLIDQSGRGTGFEAMTARLIADDQVVITRRGDRLFASPPASLAGLIEVRGLGIVAVEHAPEAELRLAVRLVAATRIERLPETGGTWTLLDVLVPQIALDASAPSAPARLRAGVCEILRLSALTSPRGRSPRGGGRR